MRFVLFCLILTLAVSTAQAQQPPLGEGRRHAQILNPSTSVFAYAGKSCPGGSELYRGPEQALAAESGVIYCVLNPAVIIYPRKAMENCPAGFTAYENAKTRPDPDVIWCEQTASRAPAPPPAHMPAGGGPLNAPVVRIPLDGEVKSAGGGVLVLRPALVGATVQAERKLVVPSDAEIVEQAPKEPEKLAAEQNAFQEKLKNTELKPGTVAPVAFEEKKISLSELKTNDEVTAIVEMKAGGEVATKLIRHALPPRSVPKLVAAPANAKPAPNHEVKH